VRLAVPDGASSFAGWWYSMISAAAMCLDASAAKRIISTAPIAKFGATKALASDPSAASRSASRSKPVVPITTCRPAASTVRALSSAVSGRVKSTTTSQPPRTSGSGVPSAGSALPASSSPSAASTAAHTAWPIRPAAPATATRVIRP
jgi:hypothetical protein